MTNKTIANFLKVSELYLRFTEQKRSAENIAELGQLVFSDKDNVLIQVGHQYKSALMKYRI